MATKDAEIVRLNSEVAELKAGMSEMKINLNNMQKEMGSTILALGRAMGYVDPKDFALKPASVPEKATSSPQSRRTLSHHEEKKSPREPRSEVKTVVKAPVPAPAPAPAPAPVPAPKTPEPSETGSLPSDMKSDESTTLTVDPPQKNAHVDEEAPPSNSSAISGADSFSLSPSKTPYKDKVDPGGGETKDPKMFELSESNLDTSNGSLPSDMETSVAQSQSMASASISMPSNV